MERDAAVRLRHWSNRFIFMYEDCFTLKFVFTHTIKQTKVFEEIWDIRRQICMELYNCVYSFYEILVL